MGFVDAERIKHSRSKWMIERSDDFIGGAHNGDFAALVGTTTYPSGGFPVVTLAADVVTSSVYKAGFTTVALPLTSTGAVLCEINGISTTTAVVPTFKASYGDYYILLNANGTDQVDCSTYLQMKTSSGTVSNIAFMPTHNISPQGSAKYNYCGGLMLDRARGRIEYYASGNLIGWYPCADLDDFPEVTFEYRITSSESGGNSLSIGQIVGRAWY